MPIHMPGSTDVCGRKPYPEGEAADSKNIRMHVDVLWTYRLRVVPIFPQG